jgi:hypothetical protein
MKGTDIQSTDRYSRITSRRDVDLPICSNIHATYGIGVIDDNSSQCNYDLLFLWPKYLWYWIIADDFIGSKRSAID